MVSIYETTNDYELKYCEIFATDTCLPHEACFRILKAVVETAVYPKNLIALFMLECVIDNMEAQMCKELFHEIFETLFLAWDNYTHAEFREFENIPMDLINLTEKIEEPIIGKC